MNNWAIPSVWGAFAAIGLGSILWFESEVIALIAIIVTALLAFVATTSILNPENIGKKRK